MSVERLESGLEAGTGHHFFILYGSGMQDTFFTRDYLEGNVEHVLYRWLREDGFERVVFYDVHNGLYFLDEESRERTLRPAALGQLRGRPDGHGAKMRFLTHPVFGKNRASPSQQRAVAPEGLQPRSELTDLNALNRIMRDTAVRGAVVFTQTEHTIAHYAEVRSSIGKRLFGLVGEWARLPFSNANACFWLCGGTAEALLKQTEHTVPDLHAHLQKRDTADGHFSVHRIGGPEEEEIGRLVDYARLTGGVKVDWRQRRTLERWMSAEGKDARIWMGHLSKQGSLSREAAIRAAKVGRPWFAAMPSDDRPAVERLRTLTGLSRVKAKLEELVSHARIETERQKQLHTPQEAHSLHLVFKGNPGTGKTTVARLVGEILRDSNLLRRGHTVEVARASQLIGGYLGHTAIQTHAKIDEALDGVLFIDEAHQLVPEREGSSFGPEAVQALLTRMENERNRLVVIVAGYGDKMDRFISSDPGLPRRFPLTNHVVFEDFSPEELLEIWSDAMNEAQRLWLPETLDLLGQVLEAYKIHRGKEFGNAGEVRNIAEQMARLWSSRVAATMDVNDRRTFEEPLRPVDIPPEYVAVLRQSKPPQP